MSEADPQDAPVTPTRRLLQRFAADRAAMAGLVVLCALAAFAAIVALIRPYGFAEVMWERIGVSPSAAHLFGTDYNGRDLLMRCVMGIGVSLSIGFVSAMVSLVIGVIYGMISGYAGGRVDAIMMRIVDALYAVPFMFFVIIIVVLLGRNFFLLFVAIGAIQWLTMARIVRAQTLAIRQSDYVTAARVAGASPVRIVLKQVLPNLLGVVAVYVTLIVPDVILIESFLSFLGLGIQEPLTSLGVLISEGAKEIYTAPWLLIFPSLTLIALLLSLNLIGNGLRDALDVKL